MRDFETELQVRFGHVDPAGIAYFPRLFDYVHDVFEEVWEKHVGQRYYHLLLEQKIGFPLVHADVDFRTALRFGDRPKIRVTCFHLGKSSLGLRYRFHLDEVECLEARMTTACVQVDDMKSMPIPPRFRARFEAILEEASEESQ
ncbi:MAG: acyl-CoA thioesterase [bacterium]|nr:acyl-CoA thioesterase [bacterium]